MTRPPRPVPYEPLDSNRFELGECARWDGTSLWMVDILAGDLWRRTAADPLEHVLHLDVPLGAANPATGEKLVLAAGDGVALLAADNTLDWLGRPASGMVPARRMNDAAVDVQGRLWCGSMDYAGSPGNGALHQVTADRTIVSAIEGLGCPNGPAFSGDGRWMYVVDSSTRVIQRHLIDAGGGAGRGDIFVTIPSEFGLPDGVTVDAEDHLWVALWGAGAIARIDRSGKLTDLIGVPARQPTSVCFADEMLIVTTARMGLRDPGPMDGAVLVMDAPVRGRPAERFICNDTPTT